MTKTKLQGKTPESEQLMLQLSQYSAKQIKQWLDEIRITRELQSSLERLSELKDGVEPELRRINHIVGAFISTITYPSEYHILVIRITKLEEPTLQRVMNRIHRIMKKYHVPRSVYQILSFS